MAYVKIYVAFTRVIALWVWQFLAVVRPLCSVPVNVFRLDRAISWRQSALVAGQCWSTGGGVGGCDAEKLWRWQDGSRPLTRAAVTSPVTSWEQVTMNYDVMRPVDDVMRANETGSGLWRHEWHHRWRHESDWWHHVCCSSFTCWHFSPSCHILVVHVLFCSLSNDDDDPSCILFDDIYPWMHRPCWPRYLLTDV